MSGYDAFVEPGAAKRVDTGCSWSSGQSVITDASCAATDVGLLVQHFSIPAGSKVGTVNPGVSFTIVNAAGSAATATANGSNQTITLTDYRIRFVPRTNLRTGKRLVVLAHADTAGVAADYGGAMQWMDLTNYLNSVVFGPTLASAGFLCVAGDFGGSAQFGADPSSARLNNAWTTMQTLHGCASDGIVGVGTSMGAAVLLQFHRAYSALKALYGIIPGVNLGDIYTNNLGGLAAAIGSPWGVTPPAALPAHADPMTDAGTVYNNVVGKLVYGGADTLVTPTAVQAFATAAGSNWTAQQIDNTLNHGDGLIGKTDLSDLQSFLAANGA